MTTDTEMTTDAYRVMTEAYVFSLGASARLRALTKNDDVVVLSATDGTYSIYDEEADEMLEEDLSKDDLMDRLSDAATADLNRIFGDGSMNKSNADLHPIIQKLVR